MPFAGCAHNTTRVFLPLPTTTNLGSRTATGLAYNSQRGKLLEERGEKVGCSLFSERMG